MRLVFTLISGCSVTGEFIINGVGFNCLRRDLSLAKGLSRIDVIGDGSIELSWACTKGSGFTVDVKSTKVGFTRALVTFFGGGEETGVSDS